MDILAKFYIITLICLVFLAILVPKRFNLFINLFFSIFQRINIVLPSLARSIQAVFFLAPIGLIKEILSRIKTKDLVNLLKNKYLLWTIALLAIDTLSIIKGFNLKEALILLIYHAIALSLFLNSYFEILNNSKDLKRTIIIILVIFWLAFLINLAMSFFQVTNCPDKKRCMQLIEFFQKINTNQHGLWLTSQSVYASGKIITRPMGFFYDTNINAGLMVLGMLISQGMSIFYLLNRKLPQMTISLLLFITSALGFLLTTSRSAMLGYLFTNVFFIIGIAIYLIKRKRFALITGLIIIGLLAYLLGSNFLNNQQTVIKYLETTRHKSTIHTVIFILAERTINYENDSSFVEHINSIKEALAIFKGNKFFGIGLGSYEEYFQDHINSQISYKSPHSFWALILAEQGIIGAIGYFGFLAFLVTKALIFLKSDSGKEYFLYLPFVLSIILFLGTNIFYYYLFMPFIWIYVGIGAGIAETINRKHDQKI